MREMGEGVPFTRTRRITGYLVGSLDRFNTAKREEVKDRVKHSVDRFSEALVKEDSKCKSSIH